MSQHNDQFAKMGEVVLNFAEVAVIIRYLPTAEAKGGIEVSLKSGLRFTIPEGSSAYETMAAWLRDTPEFGPPAKEELV